MIKLLQQQPPSQQQQQQQQWRRTWRRWRQKKFEEDKATATAAIASLPETAWARALAGRLAAELALPAREMARRAVWRQAS